MVKTVVKRKKKREREREKVLLNTRSWKRRRKRAECETVEREDSEYASGYYDNAEQEKKNYLGGRERSSVKEDEESIKRAEQYKR